MLPLLHGPLGEDGTVQGMLELADVAYVGSGVLGSALAMDKATAKQVLAANGIAQARFHAFADHQRTPGLPAQLADELGLPCFVKPSNMGSSVGVTKAHTVEELRDGIDHALTYDEWVVAEEAVVGREIEVAVLGGIHPEASGPGEIVPGAEFYDYEDKYVTDGAQLLIPAPLTAAEAEEVRALAVRVFQLLRCDGLARVDFFFEEGGRGFLCNEANTMPGFTPISMYPKLWQAAGLLLPRPDRPPRRARRRAPRPPPPQHQALTLVLSFGTGRIGPVANDRTGRWSVVRVLDDAVGAGEHQGLVPVVEAHEIRRGAVRAADFDHLTLAFRHADRSTPHVEHVTDFGSHPITSTPQGRSARQVAISLTSQRRTRLAVLVDEPSATPA